MSNSEHKTYSLHVNPSESGFGVMVINAEGTIVGRSVDDKLPLELNLPHGLYTVRSTRSGTFTETTVRLDHSKTVSVDPPPIFSAAMIPGAKNSHEYYTESAWQASYQQTTDANTWNGPADSGLLLFARAANKCIYSGEDQLASLSLRDLNGRTLSEFRTDTERNMSMGWSAFSAQLSHGLLILEDNGEKPRQIPIPLLKGWQTQLYVIHKGRLLWEDMRVIMVPKSELSTRKYRSPYDSSAEDVKSMMDMDSGLLALQNNDSGPGVQLITSFLNSESRNPLLGLLGTYLTLLQSQGESIPWENMFESDKIRALLNELSELIPLSSDIVALRLFAKGGRKTSKSKYFQKIPLFRFGAEVLLKTAASIPELIPEGSLLDIISDGIYGDTVWTTWKPVKLPLSRNCLEKKESSNWVEQAVADIFEASKYWERDIIFDDLVRRVGVSPFVMREAMERVAKRPQHSKSSSDSPKQDMNLSSSILKAISAAGLDTEFEEKMPLYNLDQDITTSSAITRLAIKKIYKQLLKTLYEASSSIGESDEVPIDSLFKEIVNSEDPFGRILLSRRLTRIFADYNITLTSKELNETKSLYHVAKLIINKMY